MVVNTIDHYYIGTLGEVIKMTEIIKRCEGEMPLKEKIPGELQISYNSYGHLCIRFIHNNSEDTLLVFDKDMSENIIDFCQKQITERQVTVPF